LLEIENERTILALATFGLCAAPIALVKAEPQVSDERSALKTAYGWKLVKIFAALNLKKNNNHEGPDRGNAEGTTVVGFTINREGKITDSKVVTSSGNPVLDKWALSVVSDAQNLPEFLPGMTESTLTLNVPFKFHAAKPPRGTAQ
jgi:TonB family protein